MNVIIVSAVECSLISESEQKCKQLF